MSDSNLSGRFFIPVGMQGDDFGDHDSHDGTPAQALRGLASEYRFAADLCDWMAEFCDRYPDDIEMWGDAHVITIEATPAVLAQLVEADLVDASGNRGDVQSGHGLRRAPLPCRGPICGDGGPLRRRREAAALLGGELT
jgi:hypothetical protein